MQTAASTNSTMGISLAPADTSSILIDKCILKGVLSGTTDTTYGIRSNDANVTANITNCILYDYINSTNTVHAVSINNGATVNVYNATIQNSYVGVYRAAGTVNATNVGCSSVTTGFSGTITQTTCSITTPTFVDAANDDFHLASGDTTWKNQGTDLSGTFTDDIDGQTRPTGAGTWDIGADEYVSAGVTAAITGTAGDGCTEADIVTGGQTIIITLTGDTWIPA
jgi:hypothetical protein